MKIFKDGLTRRTLLKSISAVIAAAPALAHADTGKYVVPQDNLDYDKDIQIKFNTGTYNCGNRCLHKFHVRNGRILRMTSAGDIPRAGSDVFDECMGTEAGKPSQQRACVRGYGYIQHNYQPNRLKYPLLQTKKRGD